MSLPSPDDMDSVKLLRESDPVFKEKLDFATTVAGKIGLEAMNEIHAAQLSLQRLSEGGYPPEMVKPIKDAAKSTFNRYAKFMGALVSLAEPRLSRSCSPGQSPVIDLPSELLSVIFTLAAENPRMVNGKRWMPRMLRLVCRRWKKVAEETPTLWRNIYCTLGGLEWTQREVQWSKAVLLDVHLCSPGWSSRSKSFVETARVVLSEISRIRTLDISTYGKANFLELEELFASRPAPFLADFQFTGGNYSNVNIFNGDTFGGEVPTRMRSLVISGARIHTSCPMLRAALTTLDLRSCSVWEDVDQLLHTLVGLPTLEHLSLMMNDDASHIDVSKIHDFKVKEVKLPNLRSLQLRDDVDIILAVLIYLDISNAAKVSIAAEVDSHLRGDDLSELNTVFGSYITGIFGDNPAPTDAFTTLTLASFPEGDDEGYYATFTEPAVLREGLLEFSLGFNASSSDSPDETALLMRTLAWTPLHFRITRLVVTGSVEILDEDSTWVQLLGSLQSLEEVHVGEFGSAFMRALSALGSKATRLWCKLVFTNIGPKETIIDALIVLLTTRHELGLPPLALSFIDCAFPDQMLATLKETSGVGEVHTHTHPGPRRRHHAFASELSDLSMLSESDDGST